MISEISHASKEQSQGVQEINKAISQLDQVTQQNSAVAQQSSSQAEELSIQAEKLQSAVIGLDRFVQGHQAAQDIEPIQSDDRRPQSKKLAKSVRKAAA